MTGRSSDGKREKIDVKKLNIFMVQYKPKTCELQAHKGPGTPKKLPAAPSPNSEFDISMEELVSISREHDLSTLQQYGGASSL
nr:calcium-transporting ATPase 10, plasma membrane-type-like isoform X1 [Ipomoea batatas]